MNAEPVTDKGSMYRRLAAGEFGNTIRQYFDYVDWVVSEDAEEIDVWGVRTLTPGGPCRLNCPACEVRETVRGYQKAGHKINISMMVDAVATVTAWLEIWDSPTGLVVEGIEYPDTAGGWTWRNSMPDPARRKAWHGTAARMVLRRHLNANSLDDLFSPTGIPTVLKRFPGHVVELSALDRCLGTLKHRNAIVWEVRNY